MRRSPLVPAIQGAASRAAHSTSTKSAPARPCLPQQAKPLLLAAAEIPALPCRAAGHDDATGPARQRASHVRVGDGVEPDLDQIGLRLGASAAIAQLGERLGANDDAEVGHK